MTDDSKCVCRKPKIVQPLRWRMDEGSGFVRFFCNRCRGCYHTKALDDLGPVIRHLIWSTYGVEFTRRS